MRGLNYLFNVPKGEKVTEKHFRRILLTSVCSILLSMTCLVSTTWALFSVTVEGKGQMYVADLKPVIKVLDENDQVVQSDSTIPLSVGSYNIVLDCSDPAASTDAFNRKATRYIILTVLIPQNDGPDKETSYYLQLDGSYTFTISETVVHQAAELSIAASWVMPTSLAGKEVPAELTIGEPQKLLVETEDETDGEQDLSNNTYQGETETGDDQESSGEQGGELEIVTPGATTPPATSEPGEGTETTGATEAPKIPETTGAAEAPETTETTGTTEDNT